MGCKTFKGGVHPFEGKELAKDAPIKEVLPKGELVYPLSQHIGAPASPIVAVGDAVLKGQKIAEANGFVSSPIYASASGTVKAIEPRRVAVGDMVNSIVIDNDGEFKEVEYTPCEDVKSLSKEEIINKVKEAGVVGMGGAGFPTHVKLSPKEPEKIEYIIANCAECEPYLTADYRRMIENPTELIEGMRIILQLFDNAKAIFGIENNKPDCIEKMQELVKDEPRMEVCPLETKYPQGGERQLIFATTGRSINSKMLPADAGCIVDNVETIISIYNAVKLGKPVMTRVSTITGDAIENPGNFLYSIGTNYAELVEAAGGFKVEQPEKIISGGPMMGFSMFSLDIPTTKTSSSLLCFAKDQVAMMEPSACINCGRCVEACPEQLIPSRLAKFANNGASDMFEKWYGLECVECGSCSFVCPARRQLAQSIKTMKKQVLAAKRAAAAKK
ncbi:MAG: electron transport complex subunit RsxC [Roseburia sp.]